MRQGRLLAPAPGLDELDRRHALQLVAEVVAHGRLQHLVDQVGIVPTMEITLGAAVSGTWICTCSSIVKTKPSRLLATICDSCASSLWASLTCFGPVEAEDGRGHVLGFVARGG